MENPASHSGIRRTCPACRTQARPGYKFCEVCGTRIPELSTCTHCGTQFIAPVKYCDLCGAPVVQEAIPGPYSDEAPEEYEEEVPEPDTEEIQEEYEEEVPETDTEETPEQYEKEIPEPDTAELLKQFGDEYADDETLDSASQTKHPSRIQQEPKKVAAAPAKAGRGSPGTVDEALFLREKKPEPAKRPVIWMKVIGAGIVFMIIIAAVYFIGLPMLTDSGSSGNRSSVTVTDITSLPESTIVTTITPTPVPGPLVPLPTQVLPADQKFYFQVQKSPVTSRILVIFAGSAGSNSISSADIKVTHPDGSVATGVILPLKGVTEMTLDGSKETDRVEIIAKMSSGETYRVYDELVPGMK